MTRAGVLEGLDCLRRDHPWPDLNGDVAPFYVALDGGGRHLITDLLLDRNVKLMVEVGCFLCGSTRQWLEAAADLTVVGVDTWDLNWSLYIQTRAAAGIRSMATLKDPETTAQTILQWGNYYCALNNIRDLRDRFIPVRQPSPDALCYLAQRKIEPGVVYIDAGKESIDLEVAHEMWPHATLCGDDWFWKNRAGEMPMQLVVTSFAAEHGFTIIQEADTWVLEKT